MSDATPPPSNRNEKSSFVRRLSLITKLNLYRNEDLEDSMNFEGPITSKRPSMTGEDDTSRKNTARSSNTPHGSRSPSPAVTPKNFSTSVFQTLNESPRALSPARSPRSPSRSPSRSPARSPTHAGTSKKYTLIPGSALASMLTQALPTVATPARDKASASPTPRDPLPALVPGPSALPTPSSSPKASMLPPRSGSSPEPLPALMLSNTPQRRKQPTFQMFPPSHSMDLQRLITFQRQPKNLSPATLANAPPLLPLPKPDRAGRMLLVLDLDETLVHASFTPAKPYNVKITINVDGNSGEIFVAFRPHMKTFLKVVSSLFEICIFTASQKVYAHQLMEHIDPGGEMLGTQRLFREACTHVSGANVKDLSRLGRPLERIAIIDNSPVAYLFQPRNAIPILSWFEDPHDTELLKLIPMLRHLAAASEVYDILDQYNCSRPPADPSAGVFKLR